jgi:hypothetical protein
VFTGEQRWGGGGIFLRWLSDTKNWRGTSVYIGVGREGLEEGEQSLAQAATGRGCGAVNFRIGAASGMNECQLNLF